MQLSKMYVGVHGTIYRSSQSVCKIFYTIPSLRNVLYYSKFVPSYFQALICFIYSKVGDDLKKKLCFCKFYLLPVQIFFQICFLFVCSFSIKKIVISRLSYVNQIGGYIRLLPWRCKAELGEKNNNLTLVFLVSKTKLVKKKNK